MDSLASIGLDSRPNFAHNPFLIDQESNATDTHELFAVEGLFAVDAISL
jgi:hypothetical protein